MSVQIDGSTGNIIAIKADYSGDVSIGGTLTYEDVTNIDSVGIITARSGINVTGGDVGIGLTNPEDYGNFADDLVIYDSSQPGMTFASGTSGYGSIYFADGTAGNAASRGQIQYGHSDDYMAFATAASERLRITSAGRLGIGTDTPQQDVQIDSSTETTLSLYEAGQKFGALQIQGSSNFGTILYSYNGNPLVFSTNTGAGFARALTIDTSQRVLIGTTTEGEAGADEFTVASSGDCGITIRSGSSDKGKILFSDATSGDGEHDGYIQYEQNNRVLRFGTATAERMRIDSSGNMGLGTNSPTSVLHIKSDTNNNVNNGFLFEAADSTHKIFRLYENNTGEAYSRWYFQDSPKVLIRTNGANYFNGGDFGIGTESPALKLHVEDSVSQIIRFTRTGIGAGSLDVDSSGNAVLNSHTTNKSVVFHTQTTERMRVISDGSLRVSTNVGDSDIYGSGSQVHGIHNDDGSNVALYLEHSHNSTPYGLAIDFSDAAPDNNTNYFINCFDNSVIRFKVHSDGDVDNHDNSYSGMSDLKHKQDIVDAGSQWDDIKDLRVRKFKFKSDVAAYGDEAKTLIGVVAQEIESVSPGLVKESPDVDDDGNDLGTTTKSVRYSVLYMKAVKALQEAQTRIETLETQNTAQQTQIDDLLARVNALEG